MVSFKAMELVCGRVNRPMVTRAKGTAIAFMKGMRRPPL